MIKVLDEGRRKSEIIITAIIPQDDKEKKSLKATLPAFIPSLLYCKTRSRNLNDIDRKFSGANRIVLDFDNLTLHAPHIVHDLPAGGRRLMQTAEGYEATVVAGEIIQRHGVATGAKPGRLVRGARAA